MLKAPAPLASDDYKQYAQAQLPASVNCGAAASSSSAEQDDSSELPLQPPQPLSRQISMAEFSEHDHTKQVESWLSQIDEDNKRNKIKFHSLESKLKESYAQIAQLKLVSQERFEKGLKLEARAVELNRQLQEVIEKELAYKKTQSDLASLLAQKEKDQEFASSSLEILKGQLENFAELKDGELAAKDKELQLASSSIENLRSQLKSFKEHETLDLVGYKQPSCLELFFCGSSAESAEVGQLYKKIDRSHSEPIKTAEIELAGLSSTSAASGSPLTPIPEE